MDQSVLWKLSYGMYAVGVNDGKKPTGCIINTAIQITNEPMVIAISINKNNYTHDVLINQEKFALSILSEETEPLTITYLGFQSGLEADKFANVKYEEVDGLPVVNSNICGYLICSIVSTADLGTHTVFHAKIEDAVNKDGKVPMTYTYYHNVIKGKAPKNAPTYQK